AAGNSTTDTTSNEVVIDITPPAAPVINPIETNDTTPVITGTATLGEGESLTVTVGGATYEVTPDTNGNWSIDTETAT
ncbi:hypothetical protein ACTFDH_05990, partial [Campylobacter jejuni]